MFDSRQVRDIMLDEVPLAHAGPDTHPVELASLVDILWWQEFLKVSHRPITLSGYRALEREYERIMKYWDSRRDPLS